MKANKVIIGFDTETTSDGKARVVATHEKAAVVSSFEEIAEFLKLPTNLRSKAYYVSWNLGFDSRAILKWLPPEVWKSLYDTNKAEYGDYRLELRGKKVFKIGYPSGKRWWYISMYDVAQFYGYQKLETAASQYLGKHKDDKGGWVKTVKDFQNVDFELQYLRSYADDVKYYCQLDAQLAKELAEYMFSSLEAIGVDTSKPISQASMAGKMMLRKVLDYPNEYPIFATGFSSLEAAKMAYHGGLFSIVQRGKIDQPIHEYDIVSAYPSIIKDLPHWRNGEFQFEVDEDEIENAEHGWVVAVFDCEWIPYPIQANTTFELHYPGLTDGFQKYLANTRRIMYPSGKRVQFVTLEEVRWMKQHGFPCYTIGGVIWNQTREKYPDKPFAFVQDLFNERQRIIKERGKKDMRQYAIKILLNSMYGKMAQDPAKYGYASPTTNYFYASIITAKTRLKVAEVALNHKDALIEIATDGVYLTEPAPELTLGKNLGEWEHKEYKEGLFIGGGIRELITKDGEIKIKARGIGLPESGSLEDELRRFPKKYYYSQYKRRPLMLGEILRTYDNPEKFKPDLMNVFCSVGRRISPNLDFKRKWQFYPDNWGEFFDWSPIKSEPWTVEEINAGIPLRLEKTLNTKRTN